MKKFAYLLIGVVSIFCLTGLLSSTAEASDFLGDFCWQFSLQQLMPPSNPSSGIIKLGVSDMGGGHYLLSGKATVTATGEEIILSGNAELFSDNKIHTSLRTSANDNNSAWSETYNVVLDSSLNGIMKGFGSGASKSSIWSQEYYMEGAMTFITCP